MKKLIFWFLMIEVFIFSEVKFEYGFDLRLREEYLGNIFEPVGKEDDNYFRLKTSLWGKWSFCGKNTIFIRFSGEPRFYLEKDGFLSRGRSVSDDEFIFENFYFEFKKILGSNWDLKIGRQDFLMQYGEGFIIMEGTPGDGSRTFYFNALKATYNINDKNSIDFIFHYAPVEDFMPIINDNHKRLMNSEEKGAIIYGKLNPKKEITFEPYYIYINREAYTINTIIGPQTTPGLELNTIGARGIYKFDPWKLRGEIAYQWGEYENGIDKRGLGGYIFLTRTFKDIRFMPSIDFGFAYLSGDDPNKPKDTGWDPLYGKWPWISELLLYYYFYDGEIAKFTNYNLWRTSLNLILSKNTNLSLSYNFLRANHPNSIPDIRTTNLTRGHLPTLILRHKFTQNISSHLWIEYFSPGNYYEKISPPDSLFIRWEIAFKF
ncbi:MAG: alginate export family protein [Candidatus Omnitrophica bacterium]|nr:alginate export family protein [Candidatus Omnitrophota bacterium]